MSRAPDAGGDRGGSGRPTRFFLLRHGLVEEGWRDRIYGCLDVPLSAEGREQARRSAGWLEGTELAAVVSSGLERTEYGAALLRAGRDWRDGRGGERRDEPDLREMDRGAWAGLTFAELERREPGAMARWRGDPVRLSAPGGETLADVAARILPRLGALAEEFPGGRVAVVTHSWVIRLAACAALGLDPSRCPDLRLDAGSLTVLDWPPDGASGGGGASLRPTLVSFGADRVPDPTRLWFRGPHRG